MLESTGTVKNTESQAEDMKRVHFKPFFCRAGIAIAMLFAFSSMNNPALSSPQYDGGRPFFADQSESVNDGFATSRSENRSNPPTTQDNPVRLEVREVPDATEVVVEKEVRDVTEAPTVVKSPEVVDTNPSNRPVTLEEMPDWQLMHSNELPFGDYFIDTRIVGAVRYHADFSLETEYDILRELSNIQKDLSQYLAIGHPQETIEVFFFSSKDTYRKFLAVELPEAPYDRDALYIKLKAPGMVLVFRDPSIKENLRHEMTHAFLHACMPYVPLWLDEGLAKYFEMPRETRARVNPYFTTISRKITFGQVPSLTRLEKLKYFDQMGNNEYCEAWSWVHFMIHHSRETHQMLAGYLRLLAERGDRTPPLEPYLTKTVPETKKAYLDHYRNWKSNQESSARPNTSTKQSSVEPTKPSSEKTPANERTTSRFALGWSESVFR